MHGTAVQRRLVTRRLCAGSHLTMSSRQSCSQVCHVRNLTCLMHRPEPAQCIQGLHFFFFRNLQQALPLPVVCTLSLSACSLHCPADHRQLRHILPSCAPTCRMLILPILHADDHPRQRRCKCTGLCKSPAGDSYSRNADLLIMCCS